MGIDLTEEERRVLMGLLPRIYAARDEADEDDPRGILYDDLGWCIERGLLEND